MSEAAPGDLRDIVEIQKLKADYCWAVDAAAGAPTTIGGSFHRLFTDDMVADYGFGLIEGPQALAGFLVGAIGEQMETCWHAIHTPRVEVDGDTAHATWTVIVRIKAKGAATSGILFGRYQDAFRRASDGWRIHRVRWSGDDLTAGLAASAP